MKTFDVQINHDTYITYRVKAEDFNQAFDLAMEGQYEFIADVTCVDSHHEKTTEVQTPEIPNKKYSEAELYHEILHLATDVESNCEIDDKRHDKISQVIEFAKKNLLSLEGKN